MNKLMKSFESYVEKQMNFNLLIDSLSRWALVWCWRWWRRREWCTYISSKKKDDCDGLLSSLLLLCKKINNQTNKNILRKDTIRWKGEKEGVKAVDSHTSSSSSSSSSLNSGSKKWKFREFCLPWKPLKDWKMISSLLLQETSLHYTRGMMLLQVVLHIANAMPQEDDDDDVEK